MPVKISFEWDGGAEKWARAIDKGSEFLKDFSEFFQSLIDYFEKGAALGEDFGSPIQAIWDSEGNLIGGEWGVSTLYADWKEANWSKYRIYSVDAKAAAPQVLTGATLYSLLNSNSDMAVRKISPNELIYGTRVPWAATNQTTRKILDLFPEMITVMNRILTKFTVQQIRAAGDPGITE